MYKRQNYGSSVTPPSYPSHTGYTPTGWDKDTSRVTQNMTVTVNYRPNKYTIRFDGNATDVSGSMSDMQMEYDKAKNLTSNAFSLSGHSWLNWNTAAAGNAKSYSNGQSVKNLTEADGGVVTLYAQWSTNAYTVTFVDGHTAVSYTHLDVYKRQQQARSRRAHRVSPRRTSSMRTCRRTSAA